MNEVEKKEIEEMAKAICSHCLEMTKQEQIEEMGKVMPEKIKDPLDNSRYIIFGKSLRREIARIYYNAGYRKLPVGAVVLLIGENNQALDEKTIEYFVKHNEQIRKETAREILSDLYFNLQSSTQCKVAKSNDYYNVVGWIEEIAKEYGVEVKE